MRALSLICSVLLGCAGEISTQGPGKGTPDAATGPSDSSADAPVDAAILTPDAPPCVNTTTALTDGHHNPGQDCMQGCHVHGFTMAGTLFTSVDSHIPIVGATIRVRDANNQTIDMVSQGNGNFYTATPVAFPVNVLATACPNLTPMVAQVSGYTVVGGTTAVGCNNSTCHVAGSFQIHLP